MWHVRKTDGSTYGPIDLAALKRWVEDGRVAPGDTISEDNEHWTPAHERPELGMQWTLEFPEGKTYGPVHPLAITDAACAGNVPLHTPIRKDGEDDTQPLAHVLMPLLAGRLRESAASMAALAKSCRDLEAEVDRLKAAGQPAPQVTEPAAASETPAEPGPDVMDLETRLREAEEQCAAAEAERARREEELTGRIRELEEQLASAPADAGDGGPDDESLAASYRELSVHHDQILGELQAKTADLTKAHERLTHLEQETEERLKEAEEKMQRDREEVEQTQAKVDELEEKHYALVRSYRELHDRFIQLRQQVPVKTDTPPDEAAEAQDS
jgi:hypothetical protein